MSYTINKGSKKLDSFYSKDLAYKLIHYTKATKKEVEQQEVDHFDKVCRFTPARIFSIKSNSYIPYKTKEEAQKHIDNMIDEIKRDERYNEFIKSEMLRYVSTFKIVEDDNVMNH